MTTGILPCKALVLVLAAKRRETQVNILVKTTHDEQQHTVKK